MTLWQLQVIPEWRYSRAIFIRREAEGPHKAGYTCSRRTSRCITTCRENGIVTVLIESTEQARLRLGLARNTVIRYLNHERPVYSPGFKGWVNIRTPGNIQLLTHKLVFRIEPEWDTLLIPDFPTESLVPNLLYAFILTEQGQYELYATFSSIAAAAKALNPSAVSKGSSVRGTSLAIQRRKNTVGLVVTELGSFVFAEHADTDRWSTFTQGKYPLLLQDSVLGSEMWFSSSGACHAYITKELQWKIDKTTIVDCYKAGRIHKKRFKFVPCSTPPTS